ncbi:6-phosphogluconolactonase [Microbacterium terrisoli]|jgi:6-phosphogluconolactonase|uniref:6-phosphogluconolactonase n=1 Tax=Microbacterium terrisoli TaxID=3242192 RepID=UPI0028039D89|nr:6-phosphogluconolactonase [Microbacterium protaetiae]
MSERGAEKRVVVSADAAALATSVADRFYDRLGKRVRAGKTVHVALTGGGVGTSVLRAIGDHAEHATFDWSQVHFWWGDERFVASHSPDRNDVGATDALLGRIAVPAANVHRMPAADQGLALDEAAAAYATELAVYGPSETTATGVLTGAWPSFDICFLGVGPDAHIASLFPDRDEIRITDRAAVGVRDSPKPPPERITLTRPVINSSNRVWLVLAGPDKASALGLALAGASYHSVPAAGAKGRRRTIFFVDEAAAGNVPPELIDGTY